MHLPRPAAAEWSCQRATTQPTAAVAGEAGRLDPFIRRPQDASPAPFGTSNRRTGTRGEPDKEFRDSAARTKSPSAAAPPPPHRAARRQRDGAPGRLPHHRQQDAAPAPWPAQVGNLDPDNVVRRLDRDRHRLAGSTRAAVPETIGEKPTSKTPRPRTGGQGLAPLLRTRGRPAPAPPARPPGKRHALPDRQTSYQRGPSVAVRGKPTVSPTARPVPTPSAIRPWTPQHRGPQRYKVTHAGTEEKRPA
jgi:hypothetical protein